MKVRSILVLVSCSLAVGLFLAWRGAGPDRGADDASAGTVTTTASPLSGVVAGDVAPAAKPPQFVTPPAEPGASPDAAVPFDPRELIPDARRKVATATAVDRRIVQFALEAALSEEQKKALDRLIQDTNDKVARVFQTTVLPALSSSSPGLRRAARDAFSATLVEVDDTMTQTLRRDMGEAAAAAAERRHFGYASILSAENAQAVSVFGARFRDVGVTAP